VGEKGREMMEDEYHANTVYTCLKMIPAETIPGMEGEGIKENGGGSEFKYI
jgi:hypothetical protein